MINSKYFSREEFRCGCGCGFASVDAELLEVITDVRETFATPLVITSGCRCETHNANVGGAVNSSHMLGLAVDVRPPKSEVGFYQLLKDIHKYLLDKYPDKYGIARGDNFVHIDVKPGKARRWTY